MTKPPRSESSAPKVRTLRRQAVSDKLRTWDGKIDAETWKQARAEQEAEDLARAPLVPTPFPTHD